MWTEKQGNSTVLSVSQPPSRTSESTNHARRPAPIRIVIIGNRLFREGLAQILQQEARLQVSGTAGQLDDSLVLVHHFQPSIALIDMAIPESLTVLRSIAEAFPETRVVCIGAEDTDHELITCAEAGVACYFPRDGSLDDLRASLESVARGETLGSPRITAVLLKRVAMLAARREPSPSHPRLTYRETEIVPLIEKGLSNKEIARCLSIETRTVKNHVHNILEKLQVHRRGEIASRLRGGSANGSAPGTRGAG